MCDVDVLIVFVSLLVLYIITTHCFIRKMKTRESEFVHIYQESIQEQDDRTTAMEQHMWRLEQEICRTQCCSDAKRREIATEEHLKKLSEMEVARVQVSRNWKVNKMGYYLMQMESFLL